MLPDMSNGMINSCPHARNWHRMIMTLDPNDVPIPLSYAGLDYDYGDSILCICRNLLAT